MAMMKKAVKAMVEPNTIQDGGLSALLMPVKASPLGVGVILGGMTGLGLANQAFQQHNKSKMGKISYGGGPARMTGSFTSGAVPAMHRASGGNYQVFSDMASHVMNEGSEIQNYGVTPQFVSALYGMGR